jgi:hypothetical protein
MAGCSRQEAVLKNDHLSITWDERSDGWHVSGVQVHVNGQQRAVGQPSGKYTVLYSARKPDSASVIFKTSTGVVFPEKAYHYQQDMWKVSTAPVALNTAGQAIDFYPAMKKVSGDALVFSADNEWLNLTAEWKLDSRYPTDIVVREVTVTKKAGYYSVSSPTLLTIEPQDMTWATVPGYFQGDSIQPDFVKAYAYGQGVPARPMLYRERTASTLTAIVDTRDDVSYSVIAAPGLGRDPWEKDHITHEDWRVGISHRNRAAALSPTLFFPVLGEPASYHAAGDTIVMEFRYSVQSGNWYKSLNHAAHDIYQFGKGLALRTNRQSLANRVEAMHHYLTDPKTSRWNIESFQGLKIGGQSYLGGVVGSQGDAIKNSDYGAMWMLAKATGDGRLNENVLPYALNFKLAQQQTKPGFFQGAALGQYYLAKRKIFVEEWGEFVEPISLTYYTMLDDGNILLFDPDNTVLRERLRLGAELLLQWQQDNGSWAVAYDQQTQKQLFEDIQDLRPTFYGLIVAYRILKDEKYLQAAIRGADWLIKHGVARGHFIGVCGDARYAPDFATAQTAQALLDLYDITGKELYKDAAIATTRLYTTSIYTHPIPSTNTKIVNGKTRKDWEIAQAGLGFEHGGIMGSAQRHGPIQLASHAGLFVRVFKLTGDSLLIDMARAGAIGRDAFVDSTTSVASYYWNAMNKGAGPYPHHAWWQIGWITDYLMAEAQLRSNDQVVFPRGFVTPKVGPHQSYGFTPGKIFNEPADLIIRDGLFSTGNANIECIAAKAVSGNRLYVIVLNDIGQSLQDNLQIDIRKFNAGATITKISELTTNQSLPAADTVNFSLPAYGIKVFAIDFNR